MTALEAPQTTSTPIAPRQAAMPTWESGPRPLGVAGWPQWVRLLLMVGGAAVTFAVAYANPDRHVARFHAQWLLWTAVAVVLGGLSGSTLGSGVARWHEVQRISRVSLGQVMPAVLAFVALAGLGVGVSHYLLGGGLTWRGMVFVSIVVVGALPAGGTLAALRVISLRGLTGSPGEQLAALLGLRRMLGRVLQMMGTLLLLMVLVCAAAVGWGSADTIPPSTAFIIGASGSVLIGLIHVPAAALLRRRCLLYVDEFVDIATVDKANLITAAEDRIKLEDILGVNRTTLSELQSGLVIVGPVVASTVAAVIPRF